MVSVADPQSVDVLAVIVTGAPGFVAVLSILRRTPPVSESGWINTALGSDDLQVSADPLTPLTTTGS